MSHPPVAALGLCAFGTASAELAAIAAMRKKLPDWSPAGTPGHFLKHADEQTVVAVAAVDQAIQSSRLTPSDLRDWATIAAPRFIGRLAGVATLERFATGGGPAISPHLIPQHSLHSVSGALSILLGSRQPNIGVGGGADSLADCLLAALTLPGVSATAGTWVVCTAWEPEPIADREGQCINRPACHAIALALHAATGHQSCGRLNLHAESSGTKWPAVDVPRLGEALRLAHAGQPGCFEWRLSCGASLHLDVQPRAALLSAAA